MARRICCFGETNTWRDGPDAGTSIPTSGSEYFYNWNSGEPNNTAEDYVVMYYKNDRKKWNDTNNGAPGAADHYCIEYDHTDTLSSSSYATASLTLTSSSVFDSTTKSIIRSQASRSIIRQSIRNIHDRMQFTRNLDKNISQQNIKLAFNFESETKNQIIDNFNSYFINKDINLFNNFAIWTIGNIGNGKGEFTNDILNEDIYNNNNLTIKLNSKFQRNNSLGLALTLVSRDPKLEVIKHT